MTFLLKKFVSFWLMPLPLCLTLLVVGLWCVWSSRRLRLGRGLVTAAAVLLLFFSNRTVSTWLLRPLEAVYPPVPELLAGAPLPDDLATCRAVAVLGGGHGNTPGLAALNKLSTSAQRRLVEGIRLLRALPDDARLIVSGHGRPGFPSHAAIMAEAAISLGIDPARITRLDSPRDTGEEAVELQRTLGEAPFALVTSAWHLPRATALMRSAGLNPVPCPADHLVRPAGQWRWNDLLWDTESLSRSTWAIHERLGSAWSRLRRKTSP